MVRPTGPRYVHRGMAIIRTSIEVSLYRHAAGAQKVRSLRCRKGGKRQPSIAIGRTLPAAAAGYGVSGRVARVEMSRPHKYKANSPRLNLSSAAFCDASRWGVGV